MIRMMHYDEGRGQEMGPGWRVGMKHYDALLFKSLNYLLRYKKNRHIMTELKLLLSWFMVLALLKKKKKVLQNPEL